MADTALQVVVDNVIVDVPIVDPTVVQQANIQVVKIEKLEPGVIEIEVAAAPEATSDLIVPDNAATQEENDVEQPVPQTVVPLSQVLPEQVPDIPQPVPIKPTIVSSPSPAENIPEFKPVVASTPSVPRTEVPVIRQRNKLLTSSILSADEIAKEILDRAEKKRPQQLPEGGDLIFQKQLTKRLAEKVVKEDTLNHNISIEMFTPPPAPKLDEHSDLDAQMLLQILEEGAESQYPEPTNLPKVPKLLKTSKEEELEKELALKQLMEVSKKRKAKESYNNDSGSKSESKPKKRLKNEVQRLLQDEGAINMLYAIEKGEDAKATALPSKRRMKKAMMKKAQEVSQAIMDGSALHKGLRLRHPTDQKIKKETDDPSEQKVITEGTEKVTNESKGDFTAPSPTPGASKIIRRHSSSSSYSGNNSPIRRISLDETIKSDGEKDKKVMENGVSHTPKKKSQVNSNTPNSGVKVVKNKSTKLIKKSLNNSLKKKVVTVGKDKVKIIKLIEKKKSITGEKTKKISNTEVIKPVETSKPDVKVNGSAVNTSVTSEKVEPRTPESTVKKPEPPVDQNGFKEKLQMEFTNKLKTMMVRQGLLGKDKKVNNTSTPTTSKVAVKPSAPNKQLLTENKTLTYESIWQMLQDDWDVGDDPDDPPSPLQGTSYDSPSSSFNDDVKPAPLKNEIAPLPASEPEENYSSCEDYSSPRYYSDSSTCSYHYRTPLILRTLNPTPHSKTKLDVIPENKNEVPFSHQLGSSTYMYKELMLRRIGPLTHVNIAPISTLLPQAFNVQVLKELCSVIENCGADPRCRCLLLTSSGSLFSSGVDLPSLVSSDPQARSTAAKTMSLAVKDFAHKLGMFSKMVVAGVSGPCVGLGVAMLPLCDVVLSSPRSVFLTPYSTLGYIPEAAATLTLPAIIGHRMASSMLIGGRKLTAQEAVGCGLVTQVLPEENFACQVLETAFNIGAQSAQSMESTKALMMHTVRSRLTSVLATEAILLQQHWLTHDCQLRIKEKAEKLLDE